MQKLLSLLFLTFPLCVFGQEAPASAPATAPTSAPAASVCGNGALELGETCDDGNTVAGDGCESTCQPSETKSKSSAAALGISLGASAASLGIMISGSIIADANENVGFAVALTGLGMLVVAPSAGQFYAGDKRHALIFSGARLGAGVVTGLGFSFALSSLFEEATALSKLGGAMLVLGGIGTAGLVVYEIIDAPRSVKRMARPEKKAALSLLPTALSLPTGLAPGLSLGLRF